MIYEDEDQQDQLNSYHEGYEQGRFDMYTDQMSKDSKLTEKQKHCPYCHKEKLLLQSNDEKPYDGDIVYLNNNGYLNCETDAIHMYRKINYCSMCGRKLN